MMTALLPRCGASALLAVSLVTLPSIADAAACRDEADRLSARHQLDDASKQSVEARDSAAPAAHMRAKEHVDAARKADDDGVVEECLRQLAQARTAIEGPLPGTR